jgi:hypothetical protein
MFNVNDITDMSLQDLLSLNKMICEVISAKRRVEGTIKSTTFNVGDKVHYKGSTKTLAFNATVVKVLRVNIDVLADNGTPWRIHATALTKI